MINVHYFAFGPFQENTYVLWDDSKECIILDPGNSNSSENKKLSAFITENQLIPKRLILTHAHVDHINGNKYVFDTYGLLPEVHKDDVYFIEKHLATANMYGIPAEQSPMPKAFINEGDIISFGNSSLNTLHTPGHSPGSISYYNIEDKFIIGGDVLFYGSIGRSDLPMGNHDTLIKSITEKLIPLGDDMKVYSGHGMPTTIGFERMNNPFLV
jgi:glyoxylase-like metal-dependent hydrolase (beta-lactamase superfamily II)